MSQAIQSKMMRGAAWMVLFKLFDKSLGLISTLILVRLLTPADFGIVAMAMSFVMMAEVLTAFGFDLALIQNKDAGDEHFHTAWTLNVIFGALASVVLLALAWPASHFYENATVLPVLCCLAFSPLLASLENIGIVRFRKDLEFKKEFMFRASRRFIAFAVTLPFAFLIGNYWALVAGLLAAKAGASLLSYVAHPFRPRFTLAKQSELMHFSRWMLLAGIATFFRERSTDFFLGRMHGAAALGVYNISNDVANMTTVELSQSINRALMPSFAKIVAGPPLVEAYRNAMSVLAAVSMPMAAGIFAVAPILVPVMLGRQWLMATPLLEILVFNGLALLFMSSMGSVLISRGVQAAVGRHNLLHVVLQVPLLLFLGHRFGARGIAVAVLSTSLAMLPLYMALMSRKLGVGLGVFGRAVIRPAIAVAVMIAAVRGWLPVYSQDLPVAQAAWHLATGVALGAAVYFIVILALWRLAGKPEGAESMVLAKVSAKWRARRTPPPIH
ncbi:MAG: lipopolysaccharide biosynthesis protein [Betaproteobacteria bacterium]|nr:lipopolysaccharide biosynthesis protein [Betaproteobacteria bacterium]